MTKRTYYWFKRRRYGYGWVPVTWQGWSVVGLYLLFIISGALTLQDAPKNTFTKEVGFYLMFAVIATIALLRISYVKGPPPKWRWGKRPADNPSEDH